MHSSSQSDPITHLEAVNAIWLGFSSSSHPRELIPQGLLTMCCFSQLSLLAEQLGQLIRIDPFGVLPREVSLKGLAHLDATSLCCAAQVSKQWKALADDVQVALVRQSVGLATINIVVVVVFFFLTPSYS
jgi:F-box/WD-40 domain protein MET30